jgi:hypothetical protein
MSSADPFEREDSSRLAGKVIKKLLRKRVVSDHKKQVETIKSWFPAREQREVAQVLDELIKNPAVPLQENGPSGSIGLTDYQEAKEFVELYDGNAEWFSNRSRNSQTDPVKKQHSSR